MEQIHKFHTPRNMFEKLIRESEKIDMSVNGDNLFNFIATAYHLQNWIKKAPVSSTEVAKRFIKRLSKDPCVKICKDVLDGNSCSEIILDFKGRTARFKIDDNEYDAYDFKNNIMELYSVYFKIKGH